ncbi:Metallo-dependent phosphatase-like protein [Xylaria bambusicola]|uniref:Metallo-dependent phosphatase-like protein n=1 Tax=Xylaria bambusicola TaxID=326684 RepID=UPI0020074347|nr:Metallo-dependent phosphatase-like protein [Xylaria bambusicola]KAI0513012.1 Metallo-dependent phosphatase-like protein [Xylaria bambusicola]
MTIDNSYVTDITIRFGPPICPVTSPGPEATSRQRGHRIEKDLYLYSAESSAWLYIATINDADLRIDDLVVTDVKVGEHNTRDEDLGLGWESRPAGVWIRRNKYRESHQSVLDLDVLFGLDAVDPRPQWTLMQQPLQLNASLDIPIARLTIRRGRAAPEPKDPHPPTPLRARKNGKFKIVQISDTHMVTGVGVCKDAIDADGNFLPQSVADPLTVDFIGGILDVERPDLVILTGDQLHHDILDSQSAIFKVTAPIIARSIPFATVFGNHDAEGTHALSRAAQMSLLQNLPFSLCQAGPQEIEGVGNYYLQVFSHNAPSPLISLFFLDTHGQIKSEVKDPDYEPIRQGQIEWFKNTSRKLRKARDDDISFNNNDYHVSLAFLHIPFPEYADDSLRIFGGHRREPTEGPSLNSHFYDALVEEDVVAVGCGHDHVNDFCGLMQRKNDGDLQEGRHKPSRLGPWLCYGGGAGFGGYSSYGGNRYHRRMRIWDFDTNTGTIATWKRVEYARERVDELVLVEGGTVVNPSTQD